MQQSNIDHDKYAGIPRIIMQTWKTTTLPARWQASQDAIKRLMPDWHYVLLTDADNLAFVKQHFPDFVKTFEGFEYDIQRADAIRYMWLYVNGGVYLDLDILPLKAFDSLFASNSHEKKHKPGLKDDCPNLYVVRSSIVNGVYTNAFMAAKPSLMVMLDCLKRMTAGNSWWHYGKHLKVINLTGPNMFTRAVRSYEAMQSRYGTKLILKEIPTKLIIPCSLCDVNGCNIDGAYCKSLGGSSWSEGDTKFFALIYCNRKAIAVFLIFLIVIVVVLVLKRRKKRATGHL